MELAGGVCSVVRGDHWTTTGSASRQHGGADHNFWWWTMSSLGEKCPVGQVSRAKNTAQTWGGIASQVTLELERKLASKIITVWRLPSSCLEEAHGVPRPFPLRRAYGLNSDLAERPDHRASRGVRIWRQIDSHQQ